MKNFYIVENTQKEKTKNIALKIKEYILSKGGEVSHSFENADCILTLGGDGTIIRAAREMISKEIPIFGINHGHLGYLTSISKFENINPAIDMLMRGEYSIEKRMMLEGIYNEKHIALNDIVVTRTMSLKPIKFRVFVNGEFLNEYAADGIIIATPTGSTAYNLSAGGPIIKPSASIIIVTPICAHTINQRSIVLSSEDEIDIEIISNNSSGSSVVFDGDIKEKVHTGAKILVRRSEKVTNLVKIRGGSFLDNIRNKMISI